VPVTILIHNKGLERVKLFQSVIFSMGLRVKALVWKGSSSSLKEAHARVSKRMKALEMAGNNKAALKKLKVLSEIKEALAKRELKKGGFVPAIFLYEAAIKETSPGQMKRIASLNLSLADVRINYCRELVRHEESIKEGEPRGTHFLVIEDAAKKAIWTLQGYGKEQRAEEVRKEFHKWLKM
jgi:hypothetical protein